MGALKLIERSRRVTSIQKEERVYAVFLCLPEGFQYVKTALPFVSSANRINAVSDKGGLTMLHPVMLLVSGILLVLLGLSKSWKPLSWLTPGGFAGRLALVAGIVDIVLAVMAL